MLDELLNKIANVEGSRKANIAVFHPVVSEGCVVGSVRSFERIAHALES